MKIRIVEQTPGELISKARDVVRHVEQLTGLELLKAAPAPDKQIKQTPGTQFEYKALQGAVSEASTHVKRIHVLMDEKIAAVLKG